MRKLDISKVENIQIEGVDPSDYPDFTDAFISYAEYKGEPLTDEQLDYLMETYPEVVNELAFESLIP